MAKRRETKQNKQQAVPKRKKEKCCDKTKRGGKTLIHVVGIFFFFSQEFGHYSYSHKDVQRPVCTDEMGDFVIPTLSIF